MVFTNSSLTGLWGWVAYDRGVMNTDINPS